MKKILLSAVAFFISANGYCCVSCNKPLQQAIYDSTFYPNLLTMLSAFIVLAVIVAVLSRMATKRYHARLTARPGIKELASVPLATAAAVLGIGMGGFADGIVLHQVLQWHQMLTNKISPDTVLSKSVNMFWDGIFHLFTLIVSLVGIWLLWRLLNKANINRSGYLLSGGMLMGWGGFNLVEGIIDHQVLKLHNVREISAWQDAWNYGFLAFGVLLLVVGYALVKKGERSGRIV